MTTKNESKKRATAEERTAHNAEQAQKAREHMQSSRSQSQSTRLQVAVENVDWTRRAPSAPMLKLHEKVRHEENEQQRPFRSTTIAAMHQVQYYSGPALANAGSAGGLNFGSLAQLRPNVLAIIITLAFGILLFNWHAAPAQRTVSLWGGAQPGTAAEELPQAAQPQPLPQLATPPGEHSLVTAPSVTAAQIDRVLTEFNSPAAGTGELWIKLGEEYQLDPAYALAFFIHESSAGTNPNWAGIKGGGATTHNVGNIICAGYATCYGRFRDYPDWQTGIADWYRLIRDEYVQGRGAHTLEQIIPIYAPSVENNVPAYVQAVTDLIGSWKH